MLEVWFGGQFSRFMFGCTKKDVNPISKVLHSLTEYAIIHQFEEILLELIVCFRSQLSVFIDVLTQPTAVIKFDTPVNFGDL